MEDNLTSIKVVSTKKLPTAECDQYYKNYNVLVATLHRPKDDIHNKALRDVVNYGKITMYNELATGLQPLG